MKKFLVIAAFMGFLSISAANAQTSAPVVVSDKMEAPAPAQEAKKEVAAPAKSCCSKDHSTSAKSDAACGHDKKSSSAGKSSCCQKASTEAKSEPAATPATTGKKNN